MIVVIDWIYYGFLNVFRESKFLLFATGGPPGFLNLWYRLNKNKLFTTVVTTPFTAVIYYGAVCRNYYTYLFCIIGSSSMWIDSIVYPNRPRRLSARPVIALPLGTWPLVWFDTTDELPFSAATDLWMSSIVICCERIVLCMGIFIAPGIDAILLNIVQHRQQSNV